MTTTTIKEQAEQLLSQLDDAQEALDSLEGLGDETTPATPTTQPPRVMLAFLMGLSVGLSLGAAGVAIAWGLS